MTKRLRVIAIVVFILAMCTGTASAFSPDESSSDDSMAVIINIDGVPRMISTEEQTVGDLMVSIEEFIDTDYRLENVNETTTLCNNMIINIKSVTENIITTTEAIPFTVEYRETDALDYGVERVVQEGSEGVLEITIKETVSGGEVLTSEKIDEKITKEPINKIIEKGTRQKVNTIDGYVYSDAIQVKATGYTGFDVGCNGITASGTVAQKGVIAVDPRVIPLGTKVYVPGYGVAVAEDTGGAIKGNKIDLCYNTKAEAFSWGVRNVTLYVLD